MNSRHLFASALATVFVVAAPVHAQVLRGGAMGAVGGATGGGFGAGRLGGMGNFGGQAGGAFGGDVDTMGRLNHGASRAAQGTSDAAVKAKPAVKGTEVKGQNAEAAATRTPNASANGAANGAASTATAAPHDRKPMEPTRSEERAHNDGPRGLGLGGDVAGAGNATAQRGSTTANNANNGVGNNPSSNRGLALAGSGSGSGDVATRNTSASGAGDGSLQRGNAGGSGAASVQHGNSSVSGNASGQGGVSGNASAGNP